MPSLALHQLRVAAVAKSICDSFTSPIDTSSVMLTCLFHDMGNIIKSDLVAFPEFLKPEGPEFWKQVKDDFVRTYGTEEHEATLIIAKEIGLSETVRTLITNIGFSKLPATRDGDSFEQKVSEYADLRAGPLGVLSMNERLEEARRRYANRNSDMPKDQQTYEEHLEAAEEIERQIFARTRIVSRDITEESIQPLIEKLRSYEIQ